MPRTISLTICILFISTMSIAQSGPQLNRDSETVKFVTSDIENFWRAYGLVAKETDNAATAKEKPADLGYYVGYLITQAYYRNAKDKRKAVYDLLNIQDARAFYEA